jgi:hypothetical protein
MKNTLLASVAFMVFGAATTFAAVPALDVDAAFGLPVQNSMVLLADSDGDDSGNDHSDGHSSGGHDSNDSDDDSDDDNSDGREDSSSRNRSDDDSTASGSNRRRARVPGGSGCDDPGDVAEHAECRVQ